MKRELLTALKCPYCTSSFEISHVARELEGTIKFGLIRCSCFEFPIVDGVLLLSLSKGYGGAEEAIQPFVPLQAAAIEMIRANRLGNLETWIKKHIPLLWGLMSNQCQSYLAFSQRRVADLSIPIYNELSHDNAYGVLGYRALLARRESRRWLYWLMTTSASVKVRGYLKHCFPDVWSDWYVSRFMSGDLFELETLVETLPPAKKILSLCCGNGVFEVIAQRCYASPEIVSVDGQLLNLFTIKRFFNPAGTYICHDVQFPLPFADGYFDASFSSTCLQEIPSRSFFVSEQLRVVQDLGWSTFDSFWWPESRVNPLRYYRYLQNFSESSHDTLRLLKEAAGGVPLLVCRYPTARDFEWKPEWKSALDDTRPLAATGGRPTAFIARSATPAKKVNSSRTSRLMVSPYYSVHNQDEALVLKKRGSSYGHLPDEVRLDKPQAGAQTERLKLYAAGVLIPELEKFATSKQLVA